MAFRLLPRPRRRGAPLEASIEVERYEKGTRRYRAEPVRMAIRGKEISFQADNFMAYGRTGRGARKRCLAKVLSFLKEKVKTHEG